MQLDGAIDHIGSDKPPIFVHSSYRTSSTWFWSKLRAAPSVLAYCEIFNEALAKVTRETIEAQRAESWASGHPSVAPYFLEFLPLLTQEQGLPLYDRSMPFEHFMPADGMGGALSEAETAYVASLIANAHACGKVPVLTDTSTLGRIRAFKQAFSGPAIFLHRNLFHQWASYSKQSVLGNQYFIHTTEWAMAGSQGDPFIRHLADFFAKRTREPDDEQTFLTFVLFHLYLYAHALEDVDMVLDVDALASDPAVRSVAERQIGEWVGVDIDLSDCRPHFELSLVTCRSKTAMVDTIEFVKLIAATVRTEAAVAGIEKMKDALLREWERNEFYSGALRTHHRAQVAKAAAQDAEWQAEREAASAQLVELEARHGDLRAAHEAMSSEAAGLRETVAALSAALDEATVRLRDAETRQAALQADHDALASEAGALREAAAAALPAHEQAVARMQALEASQAALQAEHVEALSRLEARSRGIARFWGR